MGKIQKALSKIFIDFAIKPIKNWFFEIISHNYLLFSHNIVWFYNNFMILNWNSEKNSWKFLENFSFYQNFQFLGSMTLKISCHNLAELWPRTKIFSPKYSSRIPLNVSRRHTYGNPSRVGDIGKDIKGSKWPPFCVYVVQKSLLFPGLKVNESIAGISVNYQVYHVRQTPEILQMVLCGVLYSTPWFPTCGENLKPIRVNLRR